VVLCNWNGAKLECNIQPGYNFDERKVSDTLVLNMTPVREDMAGMYVCQLVPDDSIPVRPCHLNVTGKCVVNPVANVTRCDTRVFVVYHLLSLWLVVTLPLTLMRNTLAGM
jgi:hypothetical protein